MKQPMRRDYSELPPSVQSALSGVLVALSRTMPEVKGAQITFNRISEVPPTVDFLYLGEESP